MNGGYKNFVIGRYAPGSSARVKVKHKKVRQNIDNCKKKVYNRISDLRKRDEIRQKSTFAKKWRVFMKDLKKYLTWAGYAFGVIAFIMIFCPVVKTNDLEILGCPETCNGLDVIFGMKARNYLGQEWELFEFSFMNLLTYVLVLVGAACTFRNKNDSVKLRYISIACFAVAAIFFFCTVSFCVMESELKEELSLGFGAVIGGISSLLAAGCLAYPIVMEKIKK